MTRRKFQGKDSLSRQGSFAVIPPTIFGNEAVVAKSSNNQSNETFKSSKSSVKINFMAHPSSAFDSVAGYRSPGSINVQSSPDVEHEKYADFFLWKIDQDISNEEDEELSQINGFFENLWTNRND